MKVDVWIMDQPFGQKPQVYGFNPGTPRDGKLYHAVVEIPDNWIELPPVRAERSGDGD